MSVLVLPGLSSTRPFPVPHSNRLDLVPVPSRRRPDLLPVDGLFVLLVEQLGIQSEDQVWGGWFFGRDVYSGRLVVEGPEVVRENVKLALVQELVF